MFSKDQICVKKNIKKSWNQKEQKIRALCYMLSGFVISVRNKNLKERKQGRYGAYLCEVLPTNNCFSLPRRQQQHASNRDRIYLTGWERGAAGGEGRPLCGREEWVTEPLMAWVIRVSFSEGSEFITAFVDSPRSSSYSVITFGVVLFLAPQLSFHI